MRQDKFYLKDKYPKIKYVLSIAATVFLLTVIFTGAYFLVFGKEKQSPQDSISTSTEHSTEKFAENNQESLEFLETSEVYEAEEEPHILIAEDVTETAEITIGIDVSRYQGNIDWSKVAAEGIDFAMIRVGYRTMESGEIKEDSVAKYNMQEAAAHGIKVKTMKTNKADSFY